MKTLIKLTIVLISFFTFNAFAKKPTYPQIFCTNYFGTWVGSYAIDISYLDSRGNIFVSINEHLEEGNLLILETLIEKHENNNSIFYSGKNFILEMPRDILTSAEKKMAKIRFKKHSKFIEDEFVCFVAQNKGDDGIRPI